MKIFKKVNDELIDLEEEDILCKFNTHSGGTIETELVLRKDEEEGKINDLMLDMDITDSNIIYKLKRNSELDDFVFYYRALTERNLYFYIDVIETLNESEEQKEETFKRIKPDKNGVFLINSNWSTNDDIRIRLTSICEEGFSEEFGEKKILSLGLRLLGDIENVSENFV